ncbi:MAG: response regulator [Deltaproteobacteria bacterium]|nr:response regulator [Deltaproteobacteria bacterium]
MFSEDSDQVLNILLVEDNEHDRLAFRRALKKSHVLHQITEVERAETALKLLEDDMSRFNIAVIDYRLPGMNGMELCSIIRQRHLPLPLVMQTGTGSEQLAVIALKSGVDDYIVKDSDHDYLRVLPACLSQVVQNHSHRLARQRAENALRDQRDQIPVPHKCRHSGQR